MTPPSPFRHARQGAGDPAIERHPVRRILILFLPELHKKRTVSCYARSRSFIPVHPWIFPVSKAYCGTMQFIRDIHAARLAANRPVISFEFFPPKTGEGDRTLLETTIPASLPT